jgi:RHS repeat-associated protein
VGIPDPDGELIETIDRDRGRTKFTYDPVGQLLSMVPEKARAELFRYDKTGNLFEDGPQAETRVYSKGNRLLQKGNTQYAWDQDGRLVEKRTVEPQPGLETPKEEVWKYQWNGAGLLQKATRHDGLIVECTYDPFARRLEKKVLHQTSKLLPPTLQAKTRFVWDGDVLVHEIREAGLEKGDPVVEERTYWFEDDGFEPLAHREKRVDDVGRERGGWFHYVNDPIGTPDRLLAEDGSIATEYERKAWGQLEPKSGAKASTPIRLQGQYWDEETGLAYNRWRYYDGEGRFVSADPLSLRGGINGHKGVNSPLRWIDPKGLSDDTLPPWKGPCDYSKIKDPADTTINTKPTPRQVRQMKEANRLHNGGALRSDLDGAAMVDSKKSRRGCTPPSNEAQVDHKLAVDNGGTREMANLQLITRKQNRDKWNK